MHACVRTYVYNNIRTTTVTLPRCLLAFSLLRSAIQCIRGARSSKGQPVGNPIPCDASCGSSRVSVSLIYTKSVLFPYPLSSCSPLFISLILTLHYNNIVYFCTLHDIVIIYFCEIGKKKQKKQRNTITFPAHARRGLITRIARRVQNAN